MATLLNGPNINSAPAPNRNDREAELHNAQIKERYRILKDAEDRQFAESFEREQSVRASVIAPERPATLETPIETPTYSHERVDSSLFTTETLDRAIRNNTPTASMMPIAPVEIQPSKVEAAVEETVFGLSSFAKTVAAVFCAVIVTMLTMICINTQIINEKAAKLAELEKQQRTLIQRSAKLQDQLEEATSDETIEEFALKYGLVKAE